MTMINSVSRSVATVAIPALVLVTAARASSTLRGTKEQNNQKAAGGWIALQLPHNKVERGVRGTELDGSTGSPGSDENGRYEHVDCFQYQSSGTAWSSSFHSGHMTTELCYDHCSKSNAAYMATMFGQLCLCGWDGEVEEYTYGGEGTCGTSCLGDMNERCGGPWSFDLYQLQGTSTGSTSSSKPPPTPSPINQSPPAIASPTPSPISQSISTIAPRTPSPVDPSSSTNTPPTPSPMDPPTPAPVDVPISSGGQSPDMSVLLGLHNAARCMHHADPLSYSTQIASTAQAHANFLTDSDNCGGLFHSKGSGYGENLHMCWTSGTSSDCYNPEHAMYKLYEEEINDGPVTEYGGHATQILWKGTTEIGCGLGTCIANGARYNVLVCNFNPPGNYVGKYEEEVEVQSLSATQCGYD